MSNTLNLKERTPTHEREQEPLIFDCFTFFNELDLLELRLNELNEVVDYFVLVEATNTHTGKEKPLYYWENKDRFLPFSSKIIHVVVDDLPAEASKLRLFLDRIYHLTLDKGSINLAFKREAWNREMFQRNAILRGVLSVSPRDSDIVIISDVDEIPSKEWVTQARSEITSIKSSKTKFENIAGRILSITPNGLWWKMPYSVRSTIDSFDSFNDCIVCCHKQYTYFLNGLMPKDWNGSTACSFKTLKNVFSSKPNRLRTTVTIMGRGKIMERGWHFHSLGGVDAVINKINSMAPHSFHDQIPTDREKLLQMMARGEYCFDANITLTYSKIDDSFPDWIVENLDKLENLIFPPAKIL